MCDEESHALRRLPLHPTNLLNPAPAQHLLYPTRARGLTGLGCVIRKDLASLMCPKMVSTVLITQYTTTHVNTVHQLSGNLPGPKCEYTATATLRYAAAAAAATWHIQAGVALRVIAQVAWGWG